MTKSEQSKDLVRERELELNTLSSSARSNLDQGIQKKNDALTGGRVLKSTRISFPWRDIAYYEDEKCVYYADVAEWKRNVPDITMHREGIDGPVAAVSHFRWNRCRIRVGIGSDDLAMTWVEMRRNWRRVMRFEWEGKTYILSRVGRAECEGFGIKPKFGAHLKIVEESSGKLLALHVCEKLVGKARERLELTDGLDDELEVLIILSIATFSEIVRRE